jgi:hypothetical protein
MTKAIFVKYLSHLCCFANFEKRNFNYAFNATKQQKYLSIFCTRCIKEHQQDPCSQILAIKRRIHKVKIGLDVKREIKKKIILSYRPREITHKRRCI